MITPTRVLAREVPDVLSEHLGLPKPFCSQVLVALKTAGRIDAARPVSPPLTPRALTRILLACTAPSARLAVEIEQRRGVLPLYAGEGQPTLEVQIKDLIEEAAGLRTGNVFYRDEQILLSGNVAIVSGSTYRTPEPLSKAGMQKYTAISNTAILRIARDLLKEKV